MVVLLLVGIEPILPIKLMMQKTTTALLPIAERFLSLLDFLSEA